MAPGFRNCVGRSQGALYSRRPGTTATRRLQETCNETQVQATPTVAKPS